MERQSNRQQKVVSKEGLCHIFQERPWVMVITNLEKEFGKRFKFSKVVQDQFDQDFSSQIYESTIEIIDPFLKLHRSGLINQTQQSNLLKKKKKKPIKLTNSFKILLVEISNEPPLSMDFFSESEITEQMKIHF